MKLKKAFTALALLLLLLLTSLSTIDPVVPWVGWEPGKFQRFGPRIERLRFNVYDNPELEYGALEAGEIDIVDWGMTKERLDKYLYEDRFPGDPWSNYIGVGESPERGYHQMSTDHGPNYIELNCNYTMSPLAGVWVDPVYEGKINPTYDVEFRRALAYLANKTRYVTEVLKGLGGEMETVLPPPPPWGPFEEYHGYYYDGPPFYEYDPSIAATILDAAGWEDIDGDGNLLPNERNVPSWVDPDRPEISEYLGGGLIFCMRTDKPLRMQWSNLFADEMEAMGIPVFRDAKDVEPTLIQVMFCLVFHLYAGEWSLPRDPDFLYRLWHSKWCTGLLTLNTNYVNYSNPTFDYWAERSKFEVERWDARLACMECQRILKEDVPVIPLFWKFTVKGYNKRGVSGPYAGETWHGLVNEHGFGINSWWTSLNARPESLCLGSQPEQPGEPRLGDCYLGTPEEGGMLIEGLSTDANWLNIISSYTYYDRLILGEMFDQLIRRDPYTATRMPWECDGFTNRTWDATGIMDPDLPGYPRATMIIFMGDKNQPPYFHDGTPVTAFDYMFTWDFLKACGPGVAWRYPDVEHVYAVDPAYEIDPLFPEKVMVVYFDCRRPPWDALQLGEVPVLPKHIWETAEDAEGDTWWIGPDYPIGQVNPDWDPVSAVLERDMFAPENAKFLIGSGPFKWSGDFVPGEYYALDRHTGYAKSLDAWDLFRRQGEIYLEVENEPPVEPYPGILAMYVHAICLSDIYYILIQYPVPPDTQTPTPPEPGRYHDADLNRDGWIDHSDFTILLGHYYSVPGEGVW